MKDYYRILGVPENATEQEIKLAYRKLAKRYHPDVNAGAKGAEERFKEIVEAYDTLSDFSKRRTYDQKKSFRAYYGDRINFYPGDQPKEKKDPRKKEYAPEDMAFARARHKSRIESNMRRRRKILIGMSLTFVLFLIGAGIFESWIQERREEQSKAMALLMKDKIRKQEVVRKFTIEDMDSPYDSLFGAGIYIWPTQNEIVVYNGKSDAVICLVDTAGRTMRNEFVHANIAFVFRDMPNGTFYVKVYTGESWNTRKKIPDGRDLGGFTSNERFFKLKTGPYTLVKPTAKFPESNCSDTVLVDPARVPFEEISRAEFFRK